MKIYVVEGATGEYSDHREWPVKAYVSEDKAKQHVVKATQRGNEIFAQSGSKYGPHEGENEYDPNMRIDYTGVRYNYYEVELEE